MLTSTSLNWALVGIGTALGLGVAGITLWPWRRRNGEATIERRLVQRELVQALDDAPSPEQAFYGYAFLQAEFRHDEVMQAELRRAFRTEWLPYLRRQLGRHLRARRFAEAEAFLEQMQWEWSESAGQKALPMLRALFGYLRRPEAYPGVQVLAEVLDGFRALGLEAAEPVLSWLSSAEPHPDAVREALFQKGGAGGRYLLRRWAERDRRLQALLQDWEAGSRQAVHRQPASHLLWPRDRGESHVIRQGTARLELDLNPFGPVKAEQDPLLPDLFYRLSPAWDEVVAPQPGIVVVPPGRGRTALLWMVQHESGLAGTALEQVLPVYVPLHTLRSTADVVGPLHDALLDAWTCLLAHDPYGLLGLPETEQQTMAETLIRAAGGMTPLLQRLKEAGLPSNDPDGQLLQEVLVAAGAAHDQEHRQGPAVPPPHQEVDLAALSRLLRDAFTAGELRRFCQERPPLRPFLDEVGEASLNEMTYTLIEYCEKRALFAELLAEIAAVNPRQYERHRPRLGLGDAGYSQAASRIPHGWLTQPYGIAYTFLLLDISCQDREGVAILAEILFDRWLAWLGPRHFVPKLFVGFEPAPCPLPPFHVTWHTEALHEMLRHRLQRAGLVVQRFQPALQGWVEEMEHPDAALVEAAAGCPAHLIRLGNRLIRRLAEPRALGRAEFLGDILESKREDRPTL